MEFTPQTALAQDVHATQGAVGPSSFHDARGPSVRHRRVGAARRAHRPRRQGRLRAERRRVPDHVVAERDEHRRPEVLPRPAELARARALGQADDRPRRRHDRRLGPLARVLRDGRGRRHLRGRAHLRPAAPDGGLQLAGVVQLRLAPRGQPQEPDVGLLHPLGRRLHGVDPRLEHQGGPHLPRRVGLGDQPVEDPWIDGAAEQGRHARAGRCRSCAAPTHGRARSSPAAARGARPRWSCSTSTTPTSASSSGARPRRRTRPRHCAMPASTCRSTATASTRSSTRTPTTRSASPTSSCTPSRTTRTGT